MNKLVSAAESLREKLDYVKIDQSKIEEFVESMRERIIKSTHNSFLPKKLNLTDGIQLMCVFNSINACYWHIEGDEKRWKFGSQDGAQAIFDALYANALDQKSIIDASYLSTMTVSEFKNIIGENGELYLIEERVKNLNETGRVLRELYNGQFENVLKKGEYDAEKILSILEEQFPSYADTQNLDDVNLPFLKRAQLCIKMTDEVIESKNGDRIENIEYLTAFADYKIPQRLEQLGILKYDPQLQKIISDKIEIPKDSHLEIEIRVATILAVQDIVECFQSKIKEFISAAGVDTNLWIDSQGEKRNYHLTRTTAY